MSASYKESNITTKIFRREKKNRVNVGERLVRGAIDKKCLKMKNATLRKKKHHGSFLQSIRLWRWMNLYEIRFYIESVKNSCAGFF